MAWKHSRAEWSSSGDVSTQAHMQHRPSRPRAAPASVKDALWAASSRLGPLFRFLHEDLLMLAATQEHQQLLHHLTSALKLFGHALMPELGVKPVDAIAAAKPETRELVSLLSLLAGGSISSVFKSQPPEQLVQQPPYATCVDSWASVTRRLMASSAHSLGPESRDVQVCRVERRAAKFVGPWVPLTQCHKELAMDDVVRADKDFMTIDEISFCIKEGMLGVIQEIDEDGDLRILWGDLCGFAVDAACWVSQSALVRVAPSRRQSSSEAADGSRVGDHVDHRHAKSSGCHGQGTKTKG